MTTLSLDIVVGLAASDRKAILVRQVIGRLPYHEVLASVPPILDVLLDDADDHDYRRYAELLIHLGLLLDDADDHDYRRYAELLIHLGLADALRDLRARASESPDPGIREVATE